MAKFCVTPITVVLSSITVVVGCGDDSDDLNDAATMSDGAMDGGSSLCALPGDPSPDTCSMRASDYSPGSDDEWPRCISDSGRYVRIQESISTIARVTAFEAIADLLFDPASDASSDAFLAARLIYQEDEGLDSRVARRFDPHFNVPQGTDCTASDVPARFPQYCVGPAVLQPMLLAALNAGIASEDVRANAARIEAALLWFLYVSTSKESLTCTTSAKDCDSAYAYYAGGEDARCGVGLARYVNAVDPYAHDRAWNGILALRCWRDLDPAEVATNLPRRDVARSQLDRAILDGIAAIVSDRLLLLESPSPDTTYHWAFVQVLGQALNRRMEVVSSAEAEALRAVLANPSPTAADAARGRSAIGSVFDCP